MSLGDNLKRPKHGATRKAASLDGFISPKSFRGQGSLNLPTSKRATKVEQLSRVDNFNRPDGYHPAGTSVAGTEREQPLVLPNGPRQRHGSQTDSPFEQVNQKPPKKKRFSWKNLSWRQRIIRSSLVIVILFVLTGGFLFTKGYFKLRSVFKGGSSAAALQANVNPSLLKGEGDGRVNIVMLGIGGDGHEGPDLTDTILIASIDPVNNKAALLSVPRDLWVKVPNYGSMKINAVYETGKYKYLGYESDSNANQKAVDAGFTLLDQTLEQVLGIPIHYHVLVNFQAFQQAINTLGGVSVDVPTELYDPTIAWENGWNPVIAKPGVQTFNGQKALLYVRSRETSSDFARTQRQRAVLVALKQKILSLGTFSNPAKLSGLIDAFGNNVVTDISISDASRMYTIGKQITNNNIQSIGLADPPNNFVTTGNIDGLSVVEPRLGLFDYTDIQNYVRNALRDGYIAKENANITILNGTAIPGLATQEATLLKSYGYNVGQVTDAPTHSYANTVLVDLTNDKDKYTRHYLEQRLGTSAVTKLPDSSISPGSANFVIILGGNAANTSQ